MKPLESFFTSALKIEKWHGAENDFLFVNAPDLEFAVENSSHLQSWPEAAAALCQRNTGLGADGVVVWTHDAITKKTAAAIWNSDGSRAQTCGNALRCLAAVLLENKLWNGTSPLEVHELDESSTKFSAGVRTFACLRSAIQTESSEFTAAVGMGTAIALRAGLLTAQTQRLNAQHAPAWMQQISALSFVQLANPHLVVRLKPGSFTNFNNELFCEMGRYFQSEKMCEELGIPLSNIGFIEADPQAQNTNVLNAIVYERGAGLTQCCGSGGCAMRVALKEESNGSVPELLKLRMPGGVIAISELDNELILSGPAQKIARLEATFL